MGRQNPPEENKTKQNKTDRPSTLPVCRAFCFFVCDSYTVLFVHDGSAWRGLRVLEAAVTKLKGVTSFTAANDLDIGDFTLK